MASVSRDPRGNGSWIARWRDPAGKQRKKSFARKVEAQRWLDQLQSEMHRGSYIDPSGGKTLVATYAQRWRDNLTHLKPSTLERYKGIVHTHILRSGAAGKSARSPQAMSTAGYQHWLLTDSGLARYAKPTACCR